LAGGTVDGVAILTRRNSTASRPGYHLTLRSGERHLELRGKHKRCAHGPYRRAAV
jgi:hypothetical protein